MSVLMLCSHPLSPSVYVCANVLFSFPLYVCVNVLFSFPLYVCVNVLVSFPLYVCVNVLFSFPLYVCVNVLFSFPLYVCVNVLFSFPLYVCVNVLFSFPLSLQLRDHEVVMGMANVKGVQHNVYYISHSRPEDRDEETKSCSNVHEADFLVALCDYLLKQGYRRSQITILTPYSGQVMLMLRSW